MLNLVITCGGPYDMDYANKAVKMFKRHYRKPIRAWCITERPGELAEDIIPIIPSIEVSGWWNKVLAFGPDMPDGWIVVIDVDLIIINDITEIIDYALSNTKLMAAYSDAISWKDCKFSSSLMVFKKGSLTKIYDKFCEEWPKIENFPGGDQVWTHPQLEDILYLDEIFPQFKRSFKLDVATIRGKEFTVPNQFPEHVKIIDFHGKPKPHQLTQWKIVAENWR